MTTSIRNQFLMILSIISLIACGFQLRGGIEANFDSISIDGGSAGFVKQLKKRLNVILKTRSYSLDEIISNCKKFDNLFLIE